MIFFCDAQTKDKIRKIERLVKKEIKKWKKGSEFDNGPGSGIKVTHSYDLDTITSWLKCKSCVEDAYGDECQDKIAIYPGWSVIGVRVITEEGIREKCFHIQEGSLGSLMIFGWKLKLFKYRNKLIYKKCMIVMASLIYKRIIACNKIKKNIVLHYVIHNWIKLLNYFFFIKVIFEI